MSSFRPWILSGLAVAALLATTGCECRRPGAPEEDLANARLDEIQAQLASMNQRIGDLQSQQAMTTYAPPQDQLTLQPVPVESAPPPEPARPLTKKEQLLDLASQTNLVVRGDGSSGARSSGSSSKAAKYAAAARKHIRGVKASPQDVQRALKNAGFNPGPIDGRIGTRTIDAIKKFQRQQGLTADGVVGPRTWAKLNNSLVSYK